MFNATYFTYNTIFSGRYGLQIADFESNPVGENEAFSPNLSILKVPSLVRFYHGGIDYDAVPTCEFSVISEQAIPGTMRSTILSWLIGKKEFKPLVFHDGDNESFTYYCVFTSASTIWINGSCHGFRLTASFDSPFARGASTSVSTSSGTHTIVIENKSDITDGYVYPKVVFTGSSVSITNTTDDVSRAFTFTGLNAGETVTVDNEIKNISSTIAGEKFSKFNKNWLRLRKGNNTLSVTSVGNVTITCPYYAMIGY